MGGSVPIDDELILSLKKLNSIYSFDKEKGILYCQSGCILENLQNFAKEHGFMMPLDLGAKGSC